MNALANQARPGAFVTLEGADGVGKSTIMRRLCHRLECEGIGYRRLREPGGTPVGEAIRETLLLRSDLAITPRCELLLMFASRAQLLAQEIEPALAAGEWVLCDRYTDSSFAYQGAARGLPWTLIQQLEGEFAPRQPDLTILLDLAPETARQRREQGRASHQGQDRIEREGMSFFTAVRAGFLRRAAEAPERMRVVDASRTPEHVEAEASACLGALIERWRGHA